MRRVVLLLLCLALTGCFKSDTQRLLIRDKLIELQAQLEADNVYHDLRPALAVIEASAKAAEMDGALTSVQIERVRETIKIGEAVDRNWRYNFFCTASNSDVECLNMVKDSLSRMGVPEKLIANWLNQQVDMPRAKVMARGALISRLRVAIQAL